MRVVQNPQMQIGEVDISQMKFDLRSRDDIPKILRGLRHLYMDLELRQNVFALLEERIAPKVNKGTGRPGMPLWTAFVCGVVRLDLNIDYDRLLELVNHHDTLRAVLGHGEYDKTLYRFQTLKDNVCLLTPALLDEINVLIVEGGHALAKKKADEALRGRCDSFVVETDVHFPTDINLLYDALRKTITLTAQWCKRLGLSDWRQHKYNIRHVKRLMRAAQNKKSSKARSPEQQEKNAALVVAAHESYLAVAEHYLSRAKATLVTLTQHAGAGEAADAAKSEIDGFMRHAERQIDQTRRRVVHGETIAHEEKVFSIFEPHTEWISKGKAGVPVELGVRVCILEDQHQFILHHQVMEGKTDDHVTVSMVTEAKTRFPRLNACSFDKGFIRRKINACWPRTWSWSPCREKENCRSKPKRWSSRPRSSRRGAHSAVESAINGLEVHGLDMCPDHGIDGFKRYVALAVVARNIHRIGDILWTREQEREQRRFRSSERAPPHKKAA